MTEFLSIGSKHKPRIIEKDWGREIIFANEKEYAGKLLVFTKANSNFSYHFHKNKKETWYVQQGAFKLVVNSPFKEHDYKTTMDLVSGYCITVEPGHIHQLIALEDNSVIIEVSTYDSPVDNYRITRKNLMNE